MSNPQPLIARDREAAEENPAEVAAVGIGFLQGLVGGIRSASAAMTSRQAGSQKETKVRALPDFKPKSPVTDLKLK